jgi:hypothetical protein
MPRILSRARVLLPLAAVVVLGACNSVPPEKAAGERAVERWQALIGGDFDKAYRFLSPGYRATVSAETYKRTFGHALHWEGVTLKSVGCREEACEVVLSLRYQYSSKVAGPMAKMERERVLHEKWVRERGRWWYLPGA